MKPRFKEPMEQPPSQVLSSYRPPPLARSDERPSGNEVADGVEKTRKNKATVFFFRLGHPNEGPICHCH